MSTKIITLDDHFYTGEPTVQLVSTWGRNGRLLKEATSLHKIASTNSPAMDYIKNVAPEPGKTIVLVVGLGDHETYGANRNGDGFPSKPVKGKIEADEVLPKHYKSYEKAHVFEHHVNSDPAKAIGRVKKAFWNPTMRRVELIEDFDNKKAAHLLEKIASGEYPAKSMGARIKYDVCTNCGNKAKTRADYCDHLKYAMSRIDPHSGIQNAALNPSPDFFDSSWVIRPADRTGYMLKKVAKEHPYELNLSSYELGELVNDLQQKSADLGKAADIEKIIAGEPAASVSNLDKNDAKLVEKYLKNRTDDDDDDAPTNTASVSIMINYKPSEIMGSGDPLDLPVGIKELIQYFMSRLDPDNKKGAPDELLKSANDHLPLIYTIYEKYPRFYSDIIKEAGLTELTFNPDFRAKLAFGQSPGWEYLGRKLPGHADYTHERPLTDMVTWTDPNTGIQYHTNYGTVQKTHDALVSQGLKQKTLTSGALMGTGALLGGAAYATRNSKRVPTTLRRGAGLVGAGLGALGAYKAFQPTPIAGPKIVTDQGETISGWTEMHPVQKMGASENIPFTYVIKRAHERPRALPSGYAEQILQYLKTAEIVDDLSPYIGYTLDFDKVTQVLGDSILMRAK
jgi:hypothetical protein